MYYLLEVLRRLGLLTLVNVGDAQVTLFGVSEQGKGVGGGAGHAVHLSLTHYSLIHTSLTITHYSLLTHHHSLTTHTITHSHNAHSSLITHHLLYCHTSHTRTIMHSLVITHNPTLYPPSPLSPPLSLFQPPLPALPDQLASFCHSSHITHHHSLISHHAHKVTLIPPPPLSSPPGPARVLLPLITHHTPSLTH